MVRPVATGREETNTVQQGDQTQPRSNPDGMRWRREESGREREALGLWFVLRQKRVSSGCGCWMLLADFSESRQEKL